MRQLLRTLFSPRPSPHPGPRPRPHPGPRLSPRPRRVPTLSLVLLAGLSAILAIGCWDPIDPEDEPLVEEPPVEGPVVDGVRLRILTEDLHHPTAIAIAPGGSRIFIAERLGAIRVIEDGVLLDRPVLDVNDSLRLVTVEQGLLGLALHPDFASNGLFYINYTGLDDNTRIKRFRISDDDPTLADSASETMILEVAQPGPRHNGGNLVFGTDGMLYIGMGEGDTPANAQDPTTLLGAMLRIDVVGGTPYAIPPDNPYVGTEGRDEIWAIGLRNPWRWSFDPSADRLIIADVGARLWEEINVVPAGQGGLNYGWPDWEGAQCVNESGCPDGTVEPIFTYNYADGSCAVVGGYVYRGTALPQLQGQYFYGDNCQNWLRSFDPDDPSEVRTWDWGDDVNQVFSFGVDADNELYVLTIDGAYRLEPAE